MLVASRCFFMRTDNQRELGREGTGHSRQHQNQSGDPGTAFHGFLIMMQPSAISGDPTEKSKNGEVMTR